MASKTTKTTDNTSPAAAEPAFETISPNRAPAAKVSRKLESNYTKLPRVNIDNDGESFDGKFEGLRHIPRTKLGKPCVLGVFSDLVDGVMFSWILGGSGRQVFQGTQDSPPVVSPGMKVRVTRDASLDKDTGKGNPMKGYRFEELA